MGKSEVFAVLIYQHTLLGSAVTSMFTVMLSTLLYCTELSKLVQKKPCNGPAAILAPAGKTTLEFKPGIYK